MTKNRNYRTWKGFFLNLIMVESQQLLNYMNEDIHSQKIFSPGDLK